MKIFRKKPAPLILGAKQPGDDPKAKELFAKILGQGRVVLDGDSTETMRTELNYSIELARTLYSNDALEERFHRFSVALGCFVDFGTPESRETFEDAEAWLIEGCQLALGTRD